ncbi:hypothetical protein MNBD_ALPHA03-1579 [hydrothermal vent metagenome]|uniref:Death on curing protein, Doc toxin n=1 Tax=hydrothermal vent metagenome TaxID=652676 RepID=A0A3B1B9L4_9ZZZZ
MANYKLSNDAKDDLIRIHQWGVHEHGEAAADEYYNAFFDHFEILAQQPLLYPSVSHIQKGYRRSICGVDAVYYRVMDNGVEIMNIIGQQDFKKLFDDTQNSR